MEPSLIDISSLQFYHCSIILHMTRTVRDLSIAVLVLVNLRSPLASDLRSRVWPQTRYSSAPLKHHHHNHHCMEMTAAFAPRTALLSSQHVSL
jgi:hypothetical protein